MVHFTNEHVRYTVYSKLNTKKSGHLRELVKVTIKGNGRKMIQSTFISNPRDQKGKTPQTSSNITNNNTRGEPSEKLFPSKEATKLTPTKQSNLP